VRRGVQLSGAVVVVTGASSGIGRAAARRFAEKGASVVLAARDEGSLHDAARECEAAGTRTLSVPTDVSDPEAVDALVQRAVQRFGGIDVWVNDAAVMAYGAIGEVPAEVQLQILKVNLFGQMNGARAVCPVMKDQGHGVIINVASLYGKMTSPYVSAYATSKFGVMGFSEVLRQELKPDRGIHVCTVLPGSVDTPIFRQSANYTGHPVKPVPPVISPDRVVRVIVRCAEHPRREVTVGLTHRVASWGHGLLPRLYSELAPQVMQLVAFGRGDAPKTHGNVFSPQPALAAIQGGWRHPRRRTAAAAGAATVAAGGIVTVASRRRSQ
jgi:short-subunit dehydrogenase